LSPARVVWEQIRHELNVPDERRKRKSEPSPTKSRSTARKVHRRFPTGDVVVAERDLAEQLRKHPDLVATALNVLLGERKVQRVPLSGYWKLNL
jgi:hypothetical protein